MSGGKSLIPGLCTLTHTALQGTSYHCQRCFLLMSGTRAVATLLYSGRTSQLGHSTSSLDGSEYRAHQRILERLLIRNVALIKRHTQLSGSYQ